MKAAPKSGKKKAAARPRELTLSEQIRQLAKSSAAADRRMDEYVRKADADRKAADRRMDEYVRKAEADRKAADLWMREHIRKTDAAREAADRRMDAFVRRAEADRKRMAAADRKAASDRKAADRRSDVMGRRMEELNRRADRRMDAFVRQAEADRKRMGEADRQVEADREAADRRMDEFVRQAEADRKRMGEDHKKSEGHRRNLSRALEDTFAASLPRAMRAHRIVIRPRDIRMRVRKGRQSRELDFVAPNGKLVLIGEVKTRLTRSDVAEFSDMLQSEFRELFPEYAGLPVYGVVAGAGIDADAAALARKRGFYILRMEGAELHPDTGEKYRAKKY